MTLTVYVFTRRSGRHNIQIRRDVNVHSDYRIGSHRKTQLRAFIALIFGQFRVRMVMMTLLFRHVFISRLAASEIKPTLDTRQAAANFRNQALGKPSDRSNPNNTAPRTFYKHAC